MRGAAHSKGGLVPDEHRPHVKAGAGTVRNPVPVHLHQPADALQQLDLVETRQAEAQGRAQHAVHVEPRSEEAHALVPAFVRLQALKEL